MSENKFTGKCPIWETPADTGDTRENHIYAYSPRAGGYYEIPYWLEHDLDHMDNLQKAKLTTILVDLRRQGDNRPYIYGKHIKEAKIKNNIYVYERANRLLEYFVLNSKNIGHNIQMPWQLLLLSR